MSEAIQSESVQNALSRLAETPETDSLPTDAELLALYIEGGNREAIETLIQRYASMVASVCRLTVSDPASAEDAFQATFLVLLKSAKKIRSQASVAAWLHGVAYRIASRIRKQRREQLSRQGCDEVILQCDPAEQDPIVQVARKMDLEALDRELEQLPERLRAPLVEHYLLGHSAPQIAERMELSLSAVEGRLKRGRRQLRTLLAKRGISLSVLAVGSSLFQKHLHASEASDWAGRFLESHVPSGDLVSQDSPISPSPDPYVSSLVQGELSMFAWSMKSTVVAGIAMLAGACAIATIAKSQDQTSGGPEGQGNQVVLNAAKEPAVLAQFGGVGGAVQPVSGLAGGGAMPSPGSIPGGGSAPQQPPTLPWQRPDESADSDPVWLSGGKASVSAVERNRESLSLEMEFTYVQTPLAQLAQQVADDLNLQIDLRTHELDLMGVDPDTPVSAQGRGSLRELLRRVLDPLELTYRVTESTIEITSREAAEENPAMRFYDLAYVLPNASNAAALVTAIQQSVDPDSWDISGGNGTIAIVGSMMIVTTIEETHQQVEVLLMNIAKMNPRNVENATPADARNATQGMTGFVGGMGGLGGGMGGFGGGGGGMF